MALFNDPSFVLHGVGGGSASYQASAEDESSNPRYYGAVSDIGRWVIIEHNTSTGFLKYKFGRTTFSTAWTNRATHTYNFYDEAILKANIDLS